MSGDYSRTRFDPRKHFTGVLMQQGRVQLDSDWNELVALQDRRLRAAAADTVGRTAVPRRTPTAFEVLLADGKLTIGPGRIYVDGLMPENHGDPDGPQVFDPVLHEPRGARPVDHKSQPYFPDAPDLPGGPFLVYLDAWERDVTFVEDPEIVEPAVGVDTTARTQTAWRVRFLEHADLIKAPTIDELDPLDGDPPAFWADLTRAPAGRLSSDTTKIDDADDPCIIPPGGGYRGLENQLYRVEIHTGGAPGTATFKWSRDNASVAAQVVAIVDSNALLVASVGRDAVLRFNRGDWVELLDDHGPEAGARGELLLVAAVDDEARRVEFTTPIPPGRFAADPQQLAARRTRLRRWDQQSAGGTLPVPTSGPVALERGVTVTFSVAPEELPDGHTAPPPFRAGDHWTFAARTAGATVEKLENAPPRGVHHHYAPLAWVSGDGQLRDLRRRWPPVGDGGGGDCTVHVTADGHNSGGEGTTIQDAINSLQTTGGTVCLDAGVYFITADTLRVEQLRGVTLRGRGSHTVLVRQFTVPPVAPDPDTDADEQPNEDFESAPGDTDVRGRSLLRVVESTDVALVDLTFVSSAAANFQAPGVVVRTCAGVRVERCSFLHLGENFDAARTPALGLSGAVLRLDVRDSVFVAHVGLGVDNFQQLLLSDVAVERNTFSCRQAGVELSRADLVVHTGRTRVAGNSLACGACGLQVGGLVHAGGLVELADNTITVAGDGIVATATRLHIHGNSIRGPHGRALADVEPALASVASTFGSDLRIGVLLHRSEAMLAARVEANTIHGCDAGVLVNTRVDDLQIRGNLLTALRKIGIRVVRDPQIAGGTATIAGNTLRDIGSDLRTYDHAIGMDIFGCARLTVADNLLERVGDLPTDYPARPNGFSGSLVLGIQVDLCHTLSCRGNRLHDVGPTRLLANPPTGCAALNILDVLGTCDVLHNTITHTDLAATSVTCIPLQVIKREDTIRDNAFFPIDFVRFPAPLRQLNIVGNRLESMHSSINPTGAAVRLAVDGYTLRFADNTVHIVTSRLRPPATVGDYLAASSIGSTPQFAPVAAVAMISGNTFVRTVQGGAGASNIVVDAQFNQSRATAFGNHLSGGNFAGFTPALVALNVFQP